MKQPIDNDINNGQKSDKKMLLGIAAFLIIIILAISTLFGGGFIKNINESEANSLIQQGAKVVDVRTPGEYSTGHIPGATNVPLNTLPGESNNLGKEEPVILVCLSGNRSGQASEYLKSRGFKKIYNLTGGMLAWKGPVTK